MLSSGKVSGGKHAAGCLFLFLFLLLFNLIIIV